MSMNPVSISWHIGKDAGSIRRGANASHTVKIPLFVILVKPAVETTTAVAYPCFLKAKNVVIVHKIIRQVAA